MRKSSIEKINILCQKMGKKAAKFGSISKILVNIVFDDYNLIKQIIIFEHDDYFEDTNPIISIDCSDKTFYKQSHKTSDYRLLKKYVNSYNKIMVKKYMEDIYG